MSSRASTSASTSPRTGAEGSLGRSTGKFVGARSSSSGVAISVIKGYSRDLSGSSSSGLSTYRFVFSNLRDFRSHSVIVKTCENTVFSALFVQNVELSLKNRLGGENVELSFESVRKSKKPRGFR